MRANRQGSEADGPAEGPRDGRPAVEPPEVETVTRRHIHCDGGEGALGHPRVWMTIPEEGFVDCGYCDKRFVLAEGADGH